METLRDQQPSVTPRAQLPQRQSAMARRGTANALIYFCLLWALLILPQICLKY
jgi:hypothetical protein